ncbi:MAG: phage late control D family protein, partial [Bdellovibrionota bacterium]
MSLLDMNQDCQVFLNMTVYEIVEKILKKTKPGNTVYPAQSDQKKIPYTVQYGESDAYFISRLLQSAGISYFFTMEKGKHTMKFYEKYDDYLPLDTVNENDLQFHRE